MSSLGELAIQYLDERVAQGELDPMTARNHRSALSHFARTIDKPVAKLARGDVEKWLETRSHLRPTTRRSQFSYLTTFCTWLVRKEYLTKNPVEGIRPPRVPKSVPRALPPEEVAATLRHARGTRGRAIVWLMVGQGLRCCEVSRLDLDDWDRHGQHLTIRGKGDNERVLPMPAEVATAVDAYLAEHPAQHGPLIRAYRTDTRLRPDSISGMVSEWMRAAGVKRRARDGRSAHAFRHTAASDVLDRCPDLRVVQQMLGHAHLTTTTIYLRRASMGQLREAMAGRTYLT